MNRVWMAAAAAVALGLFGSTPSAQAGWFGTSGDGNKVEEARQAKDFKKIKLKGSFDVEVKRASGFSVVVHTDKNLLPLLTTTVEGDTLVIETKENLRTHGKNFVAIGMPDFRALEIRGSGDGDIEGFSGSDLDLNVEGSGDINFRGSAKAVRVAVAGSGDVKLSEGSGSAIAVEVDGSGDVRANGFAVHDANVSVNGSGDVELTVNGGALSATVNGSGDITWSGDGKLASSVKHGSGEIAHR